MQPDQPMAPQPSIISDINAQNSQQFHQQPDDQEKKEHSKHVRRNVLVGTILVILGLVIYYFFFDKLGGGGGVVINSSDGSTKTITIPAGSNIITNDNSVLAYENGEIVCVTCEEGFDFSEYINTTINKESGDIIIDGSEYIEVTRSETNEKTYIVAVNETLKEIITKYNAGELGETGPQGAKGAKGEKGDTGATGPAGSGGGSGAVDTVGTPNSGQVSYFNDSNTIQGSNNLTFNGTTLTVGGNTITTGITNNGNYTSTSGNITLTNGNIALTNGSLTTSGITNSGDYNTTNGDITTTNGNITLTNGTLTTAAITNTGDYSTTNGDYTSTSGDITLTNGTFNGDGSGLTNVDAETLDGLDSNDFFQQGGNAFGATGVLGTNDANDLVFETNNTEAMRILTSGNVSIGGATDYGLLSVQDSGSSKFRISEDGSVTIGNISSPYVATSIAFSEYTLTGAATSYVLDDDEFSPAVAIPFAFDFFNESKTQLYISSNGFISFDNVDEGCCEGQDLPDPTDPNDVIAAYWSDLYPPDGGTIKSEVFGIAPNRVMVIEYQDVTDFSLNEISFQIQIYETTGVVEIHIEESEHDGYLITQGLENSDGTQASYVAGRNATSFSSTNDGVRFTPSTTLTDFGDENLAVAGDTYVFGQLGVGTSTPLAKLHVSSGQVLFTGIQTGVSAVPVTGDGTRLMWLPEMSAFRAGRVTSDRWDDPYIGQYSAALGLNNSASGLYSFATGSNNTASGQASVVFGEVNTNSGQNALLGGASNTLSGSYSILWGTQATATQNYSATFGYGGTNNAEATILAGLNNTISSTGYGGAAFGVGNTISGQHGLVSGYGNTINNTSNWSVALGYQNSIANDSSYSFVAGAQNSVGLQGFGSAVFGFNNQANNPYANIFGTGNVVEDGYGIVSGTNNSNILGAQYSTLLGNNNFAGGAYNFIHGLNNSSSTDNVNVTLIGQNNSVDSSHSFVFGDDNVTSEYLFVGNNLSSNIYILGSDNFTSQGSTAIVGQGNIIQGALNYVVGLENNFTNTDGSFNYAMGFFNDISSYNSFIFGEGNDVTSFDSSYAIGHDNIIDTAYYGLAIGQGNEVYGDWSHAIGAFLEVQGYNQTAIGTYNEILASDNENWVDTDAHFILGNGFSNASRSNALVVLKNGNAGFGTNTPTARLEAHGNPTGTGINQGIGYINATTIDSGGTPVQWTATAGWNTPDVGTQAAPTLFDLDFDNDLDAVIGAADGFSYGYENTGTTSAPVWTVNAALDTPDVGTNAQPEFVDLNDDEIVDLLIGEASGVAYAYRNTGTRLAPVWTAQGSWNTPDVGTNSSPTLADLDDDGDFDLLIGDDTSDTVLGYENTGSVTAPAWTAKAAWNVTGTYAAPKPELIDFDLDGDYDLLIGREDGVSVAFENTGSRAAPVWTSRATWNTPDAGANASPSSGRLDTDNDYDIIIGIDTGIGVAYQNTGTSSASSDNTIFGVGVQGNERFRVNGSGSISLRVDDKRSGFEVNGPLFNSKLTENDLIFNRNFLSYVNNRSGGSDAAVAIGAGTASSSTLVVHNNGNVGIGDLISPAVRLDIYHNTASSDVDIFRISSDVGGAQNVVFRIDSDGDIFTDGSTTIGTPADVAERYVTNDNAQPGDVVVFDQRGDLSINKSIQSYQHGLAGVVSTNPGIVLSGNTSGVDVALVGRVPVNVVVDNGAIAVGDYLTSAPDGKAQKATQAGPTLGIAMESTTTDGTIEVFVNLGFYSPNTAATGSQTGSSQYLQNGDDATFVNLNASGTSQFGKVVVTESIHLLDGVALVLGTDKDASLEYNATNERAELTGERASLFIEDRLSLGAQNVTITNNDLATVASYVLKPKSSYVRINCVDIDGCSIELSEENAKDGDVMFITNSSQNTVSFADINGVSELAGAFYAGQYDNITLIYSSDHWEETSRSDN